MRMGKYPLYFLFLCSSLTASEFKGIADLSGGIDFSMSFGINGDGTKVVGRSSSSNGNEAFLWTDETGMQGLGDLTGGSFNSTAMSISSDGNVIVGMATSSHGGEAFRWTSESGMIGLGDLDGGYFSSTAYDVNTDGSVIVGSSRSSSGFEAFRWTQASGMIGLGDLDGGNYFSRALGVSDDGEIVVGESSVAKGGLSSTTEAFRWTQASGMVGLGDLTGGNYYSKASDISGDGSTIIGMSESVHGEEAFRWTQASGMVGLGDFEGGLFRSQAHAVNYDGTVIVGSGSNSSGSEAYVWNQEDGMMSLTKWLSSSDIDLSNWSLTEALGVSDDGHTIVGTGLTSTGFQAFIAKKDKGLIGVEDTMNSIQNISTVPSLGLLTATTILHGTHGHPISRRSLDESRTVWMAGDYFHDDRHDTKESVNIAEVGMSIKYNKQMTYSISIGQTDGNSDMQYNGNIQSDGYYFVLESDIKPFEQKDLYLTLTYLHAKSDIDIKRGYLNGGILDSSHATTHQKIDAIKTRLQYEFESFFPYIDYEYTRITTNGYTENGGGFPARFKEVEDDIQTIRMGVDKNFQLSENLNMITTIESAHALSNQQSALRGEVLDTFAFEIEGREVEDQWFKGTMGLDYTTPSWQSSLTYNATTQGEDAQEWVGFSLTFPF